MPYVFIENEPMITYRGINIYHVYRGNFQDEGWLDYWFTTKEFGCNDDDDAFDIRDIPGFDPCISMAANLVNMIRDEWFGPGTDGYNEHIAEDAAICGQCSVCQHEKLQYGVEELQDDTVVRPFTCPNCGIIGTEFYELQYDGVDIY